MDRNNDFNWYGENTGDTGEYEYPEEMLGGENAGAEDDDLPRRKPLLLRLVALVTGIAFLGLVAASVLPALRVELGNLLQESRRLEKDIDTKRLQQAVVSINVLAGEEGSLAVDQRAGTGFNIDPGGLIITNHHVIEGVKNMTVEFPGGKMCRAREWESRPELDLAVIELEGSGLPSVPVSGSPPDTGDRVRIVGNPLGMNNIVTEGKVVRYLKVKDKPVKVFSLDAPVYPGNSGSPVFDREGRVTGVIFARYKPGEEKDQYYGLAVPVQEVRELLDRNRAPE